MSRTFLLQDWTTVRSSLTGALVQDPDSWLDLDGYSDVTCWIDIAEVTPPRAGYVQLQLQTAPSADDACFVAIAPPLNIGNAAPFVQSSSVPLIVRSAQSLTTNNLMRHLRWSITPSAAGWDLTFRIHAIAARSATFVPTMIPGCVIWYRADLGVSATSGGSDVTGWNDQSGTNDTNRNLTTQSTTQPTLNGADGSYNGQPSINFVAANGTYMTSTSFSTPIVQPTTWVIVGATSSSGYMVLLDANDTVSGQQIARTDTSTIAIASAGNSIATSNAWTSPSAVMAEFNGSTSKIFVNNFTMADVTGNAGSGAGSGQNSLTLGSADAAWGPWRYWDGSVAEIIGYDRILSSNWKAQLRSYFRGRYGIAIG